MQKDNILSLMKSHTYIVCGIALAASLFTVACTDDDIVSPNKQQRNAEAVHFNIIDGQQKALAQRANGLTRGITPQSLPASTFETHQLEVQSNVPLADACLEETTIEGFMPVKADAKTRGDLTTTLAQNFSSSGYRGISTISTTPNWFYNEATQSDGNLVNEFRWNQLMPHARFYAVYPQVTSGYYYITLSPNTYSGTPFVDFTVETDVRNQKDLMTACSGDVVYSTPGTAPTTNLNFHHALTAITFAVGENLSLNKTINYVQLQNVLVRAKYTLPTTYGTAGTWDLSGPTYRSTVTLSGLSVSTNQARNTTIIGNNGDNFTFMMIPQPIQGKNIKAVIYCTDGTTITSTLKGDDWKPGTTREYKLTQKKSNRYHITATSPATMVAYNGTLSDAYTVRSWREDFDPVTNSIVQSPMAWKVVKYEESADDGATWTDLGTTKPAWLTSLSKDEGLGGTAGEQGTATLKVGIIDNLIAYNKVIKDATPKGTATNPFNLANPTNGATSSEITESANSYLISAPGYYRIPLVYGNAIKNGQTNTNSFHTANTVAHVLRDFLDHTNRPIHHAIIREQNSGNRATQAAVVWQDQPNLIKNASLHINDYPVQIDGTTKNVDFVEFEVTKNDIRNGNAVIAVKDAGGTILWSWHLWFDHADALDKIPVKNQDGVIYKFTRNVLGYAHLRDEGTSYTKRRQIKITVAQQGGSNQTKETAQFIITQDKKDWIQEDISTLYQFGRKDALPGTDTFYDGNSSIPSTTAFTLVGGRQAIGTTIQNPGVMYLVGFPSYQDPYNADYCNTWSANNTKKYWDESWNNAPVVKTIYDPCPAGFSMPAPKAFAGFTTTGEESQNPSEFNVEGVFNKGWNFKTGIGTSTIFFPALGHRWDVNGRLQVVGMVGFYWSALPDSYHSQSYRLLFRDGFISTRWSGYRTDGFSIRPVADN